MFDGDHLVYMSRETIKDFHDGAMLQLCGVKVAEYRGRVSIDAIKAYVCLSSNSAFTAKLRSDGKNAPVLQPADGATRPKVYDFAELLSRGRSNSDLPMRADVLEASITGITKVTPYDHGNKFRAEMVMMDREGNMFAVICFHEAIYEQVPISYGDLVENVGTAMVVDFFKEAFNGKYVSVTVKIQEAFMKNNSGYDVVITNFVREE